MGGTMNLLIGLSLGLSLMALGSSRLPSIIRAAAFQGMILGTLPLLLEQEFHWLVVAAKIDREVEPLVGFVPSLLLGAAAVIGAAALGNALPLRPEHTGTLLVPGSFATVVCGFILLVARTKAISQVCGYLILENGIYLFGLLLINSTPLLVEAGILLDLTVAVFVIGIIVDRIQREFDTLDTRKLTTLRE